MQIVHHRFDRFLAKIQKSWPVILALLLVLLFLPPVAGISVETVFTGDPLSVSSVRFLVPGTDHVSRDSPAQDTGEPQGALANAIGSVPFAMIDEKLAPSEAAALRALIQNTLYAFSYDDATGAWYARNAASRIMFSYTRDGTATFSEGEHAFGLMLLGVGREDTISPAGKGYVQVAGRQLNITRPEYTEWYKNNDNGVEQGLTIRSRPAGSGSLQVRFGLSGNNSLSRNDEQTLILTDVSGTPLFTYTGLHAFASDGSPLPASLATDGRTLSWVVDDSGVVYPVTIDPVVIPVASSAATFTRSAADDGFGESVALSSDGTVALVGAYTNDTAGSNAGAAYLFTMPAGGWSGTTSASSANATFNGGATDNQFGQSVALSSNGTMALVGARLNSTATTSWRGAAYIFTMPAGGWGGTTPAANANATLSGSAEYDLFGHSVALSSDGATVLVGASNDVSPPTKAGAAYIFTMPAGGWNGTISAANANATFTGSAVGNNFGSAVALSSDGTTACIGATNSSAGATNAGAAYLFERPGGGWSGSTPASSATATFTGGAKDDRFGSSVTFNSNGAMALIGASAKGYSYLFTRPGTGWSGTTPAANANATFNTGGSAVALSSNGTIALVNRFLFTMPSGGWSGTLSSTNATTELGGGGTSGSLSSNGTITLAGQTDTVYLFRQPWPLISIGAISGSTRVGTKLTSGTLAPSGATVSIQWSSSSSVDGPWTPISGATSTTYTLQTSDLGKYIQVNATGTGSCTGVVNSTAAGPVTAPAPTPTPTPTSSPAPAPVDNGGGSSASSSSSPMVSTVSSVVAGQPVTFSFNQNPTTTAPVALNQVQIVFNQNVGTVEVIGGPANSGGSPQGQSVVGYLSIEPVGVNPNAIGSTTISFAVNGQFLKDHHLEPSQVTLMRNHDNVWSTLATTLVSQNGDTAHYAAKSPGLSYFAIVVLTSGMVTNTSVVTTITPGVSPPTRTVTTTPAGGSPAKPAVQSAGTVVPLKTTTTPVPSVPVTDTGFPRMTSAGIVAVIAVVIGAVVLLRRWWIRRQNPALFRRYN